MTFRLLAFALFAAASVQSYAWNGTGHGVIATIAYDNLKPATKAQVDSLLPIGTTPKFQSVIMASTWADATRTKATQSWHYIDWYFKDSGAAPDDKPDEENVVWALQKQSAILGDKAGDAGARADALRYVLHFVGDIHQPLHCSSRETPDRPSGDRGGNSFSIVAPPDLPDRIKNLHSLWDAGCGLYVTPDMPGTSGGDGEVRKLATEIEKEYAPAALTSQIMDRDFESWSKAGLWNAKNVVYKLDEGAAPSREYLATGQRLCRKLAAIAGYRLADLLNRLLK